jgi:eukaryotic-like serine/threonine-protein kinase
MAIASEKGAGPPDSHMPSDDFAPSRRGGNKPDPLIGKTIAGRFTIVDIIARGGMGKVYRAVQEPLDRICALKILNPKYEGEEDPEFQRRFFLEAATAAKLNHPNTVTIFDYGRDGDTYFIAMEYVAGRTLFRALREEGPFTEKRVAFIVRQVGRSLREAHSLGVIHRDMKPANIVLVETSDERDTVKVLDFGLVKDVTKEQGEDLTQQGLFMGSPKYMAPEQILGNPVSPPTDIYSLGIVAFELLTGEVPFDRGSSVKTLMAHVNEPVPRMREVNPAADVSSVMEGIVRRCLSKDPSERFANIDALLHALVEVEGGSGQFTDSRHALRVVEPPSMPGRIAPYESGTFPQTRPLEEDQPTAMRLRSDLAPTSTSGLMFPSHAPTPLDHAVDLEMQPRRSRRVAVLLGVGVAAAAIGAIAFFAQDRSTGPTATEPSETAQPETPKATTAEPKVHTVRVTSEPAGARVQENGKTVCEATPCEVTWKGDATSHKLELEKDGFQVAKVEVSATDTSIAAELEKAARFVRGARPAIKPAPAAKAAPVQSPPKPDGYKDSPY